MSVSPPSSVTKTSPCWNGLIVPGSMLMYGSSLSRVRSSPRFSSRAPMDADASPLPSELTTPPVTKMYLVFLERMALPAKRGRGRQCFCRPGADRGRLASTASTRGPSVLALAPGTALGVVARLGGGAALFPQGTVAARPTVPGPFHRQVQAGVVVEAEQIALDLHHRFVTQGGRQRARTGCDGQRSGLQRMKRNRPPSVRATGPSLLHSQAGRQKKARPVHGPVEWWGAWARAGQATFGVNIRRTAASSAGRTDGGGRLTHAFSQGITSFRLRAL